MDIKEIKKSAKRAEYSCELCDYSCYKMCDFVRHNNTIKHLHRLNGNIKESAGNVKSATYLCNCEKKFKTNAGLWKHKKKCINVTPVVVDKDLIMMLIKKNDDLQTVMVEQQNLVVRIWELRLNVAISTMQVWNVNGLI